MTHKTFFNKSLEEITWINYLDNELLNMFYKEETVEISKNYLKINKYSENIRDTIIIYAGIICDDKSKLLQRLSLVMSGNKTHAKSFNIFHQNKTERKVKSKIYKNSKMAQKLSKLGLKQFFSSIFANKSRYVVLFYINKLLFARYH